VIKSLLSGAALAVLAAGWAAAAPLAPNVAPGASAWLITPADNACHTEITLVGRSGYTTEVSLVSDGRGVDMAFAKEQAPERAFLPIRVNQKPFSNLVVRGASAQQGVMQLSDESLAALRKGGTLQIGWLADEPVSASLLGSDQGVADLRTCGAQVSAAWRERTAAQAQAKAQADADTRAQALANEQLAVVRAQRLAAEAERQRQAAEADRQRAEAAQAQAQAQAERRRADEYEHAQYQSQYQDPYEDRRWAPPPRDYPAPAPAYGDYRPYYGN
jgi:hypothetical protein